MKYTKAMAKVVLFDNSDVITTSTTALGTETWESEANDFQNDNPCTGASAGWVCKLGGN